MMKQSSDGVTVEIKDGKVFIDGKDSNFPKRFKRQYLVTIGGRVCFNGYEYVDGKWKRTVKALLMSF